MSEKTTKLLNSHGIPQRQPMPAGRSFAHSSQPEKPIIGERRLPRQVRQKMESALGFDFSQVRIYENNSPRRFGADAITRGQQIHFAPGSYKPTTVPGQTLLGHELTHVMQQQQGRVPENENPHQPSSQLEAEANVAGTKAAAGLKSNFPKVNGPGGGTETVAVTQPGKTEDEKRHQKDQRFARRRAAFPRENVGRDTVITPAPPPGVTQDEPQPSPSTSTVSTAAAIDNAPSSSSSPVETQTGSQPATTSATPALESESTQELAPWERERQERFDEIRNLNLQAHPLPDVPEPSLGEHLSRTSHLTKAAGYEFDRRNDSRNIVARGIVNKVQGAAHYAKKHPWKSAAKLLPIAPIAMSAAGTYKSHQRMKAASAEMESGAPEIIRDMFHAQKGKQKRNRNKAAIATALGVGSTLAGGVADFGASEMVADLGSEVLTEGLGVFAGFAADSVGTGADVMGTTLVEGVTEDVAGSLGTDAAEGVYDTTQKQTPRQARLALKNAEGSPSQAHKTLLTKDPKYGKAVREATKSQIPKSLEDKRGEVSEGLQEAFAVIKSAPEFQARGGGLQDSVRPSDVRKMQKRTTSYSKTALRRQLGYDEQGQSTWDEKLDFLDKKKWYET